MPIIVASAKRKVNTLSLRLAACLLVLPILCAPAHSQVALLDSCVVSHGSTAGTTASCAATVTANSFVVVLGFACQQFMATSSCTNHAFTTTQTISDDCGTPLTYTQRYHVIINNFADNWQMGDVSYNDAQTATCTGSHTFTITTGASSLISLSVMVFSGVKTSSYFDVKNVNQVSSVCSLPGSNMTISISPTGGGTYTATWNVNISCFADAGGVAMIMAYYTTFNTEILMAYGVAGNFQILQSPFTAEPDPAAGVKAFGIYEVAITGKANTHSYVF